MFSLLKFNYLYFTYRPIDAYRWCTSKIGGTVERNWVVKLDERDWKSETRKARLDGRDGWTKRMDETTRLEAASAASYWLLARLGSDPAAG